MIKDIDRQRLMGTIEIVLHADNADGYEERVVQIPIRFEVCQSCQGRGTTVNPSVDGDGITRDMFDEDPDFEESYFAGDYDIPCLNCHGNNVEAFPDESRMTPEQAGWWNTYCENARDRHMSFLESQAERRFGA